MRAAEALEHDLLDALADLGVVAVARDVDEERIKTLEGIAAHEQPHRAAFVQVDDAAGDADQILHRRLEELIARIRFEHVHYGLGVVTLRIKAEVTDNALDLLAQHRNLARA